MPPSDSLANARKRETDRLASELLKLNPKAVRKTASAVLALLPAGARLVVAGGAGVGKTTLSAIIADGLDAPLFDLDESIEGGYTRDEKKYRQRLVNAMVKVFQQLPVRGGWVVEHVHACHDDLVRSFRPSHALLLQRDVMSAIRTASARNAVSGGREDDLSRHLRALETATQAKAQFGDLKGKELGRGSGWTLKELG